MAAALKPERNVPSPAAPPPQGARYPRQAAARRCPRAPDSSSRSSSSTLRFFINSLPSSLKKVSMHPRCSPPQGRATTESYPRIRGARTPCPRYPGATLSPHPALPLCRLGESSFIRSSLASKAFRDAFCAAEAADPSARPARPNGHQLVEFLRRPDHANDGEAPSRKIVRLGNRDEVLEEFRVQDPGRRPRHYSIRAT